jgi:hypothetical protein
MGDILAFPEGGRLEDRENQVMAAKKILQWWRQLAEEEKQQFRESIEDER